MRNRGTDLTISTAGTTTRSASIALVAVAFMLLATGCGGSSGGDVATPFVGVWTFDTGSVTATCGTTPLGMFQLAGRQTTITKTDNTHIKIALNPQCTPSFTVSGTTANADPTGQMCAIDTGTPLGMAVITINSWMLTLQGGTLSGNLAGTLTGTCTVTGSGSLTKHSGGDAAAD